jgi:hypothetical protein
MRLREQLEELGMQLEAQRTALLETLPALDAGLAAGDSTVLTELQTMQAKLSYLAKWQAQVRESLLGLM